MGARLNALLLAALVAWVHAPVIREGGLLGAPGTDVARAAWGLAATADALPEPLLWTDHVGFPVGVKLLALPMVSQLLGVPLKALLGPIVGYDVWVLGLVWAAAFVAARLVEEVAESAAAGLLAGALLAVQPMLCLAVTDGTTELVAFWGVPATLLALWLARRAERWQVPVAAGLVVIATALDSPYHAVFVLPFVPLAAWGTSRRNLAILAGMGVLGLGALAIAYWGLPVSASDANRAANSTSLRVWWQWEHGTNKRPWDFTLGPTFIPVATVAGALALAALRPLRAGPWALVGLLCVVLSLGPQPDNPASLAWMAGEPLRPVGDAILALHERFPVPVVRFPRRWLVPAALGLFAGAGIGLTRLPWEGVRLVLALVLGGLGVGETLRLTQYRAALPRFDPPEPAFAAFVRDHDADGAILPLPQVHQTRGSVTFHTDLPVFAGLGASIASADHLWTQALTGRASVFAPRGLRTLQVRSRQDVETERLLSAFDDLARPLTIGEPAPPSATQEPHRLASALSRLADRGLRFLIVDRAAYGDEGLAHIRVVVADRLGEERAFEDGTGVIVFVLE